MVLVVSAAIVTVLVSLAFWALIMVVDIFMSSNTIYKLRSSVNFLSCLNIFLFFYTKSFLFLFLGFSLFIKKLIWQNKSYSETMENILISLKFPYRISVLEMLLNEDCIITHWTIHKYIRAIIWNEILRFEDFFTIMFRDFKLAFFSKRWKNIQFKTNQSYYPGVSEVFSEPYSVKKNLLNFSVRSRFLWNSTLNFKFDNQKGPMWLFKQTILNTIIYYNFFKTVFISCCLTFIYFLYTVFFFKLQFLKQLSVWFIIGMLFFWLMSGFNFFLKRYQYSKFTSQIQRFWKRTNTSFWLIEGFLILLFFYYFLNSSQEPVYMYDYSSLNQEYLVSLQVAGMNIIILSVVIYLMYFTLLRINLNTWNQLSFYLIFTSIFIFYSFFIETYQFYYVISTFNERLWVFNEEENLWALDVDSPILRTKQNYLLVCLIAKYWHFLFIFLSWVFFLIKSFEKRKITYPLFGVNLQNMLILYFLNFACYVQWAKWFYRRFFDLPYNWFMVNIDNKFLYRLFFEIKLLVSNIISANNTSLNIAYVHKTINLWNVDTLALWKFI